MRGRERGEIVCTWERESVSEREKERERERERERSEMSLMTKHCLSVRTVQTQPLPYSSIFQFLQIFMFLF